jgi:hypothetical protein
MDLRDQLAQECQAMLRHALGRGTSLPPHLYDELAGLEAGVGLPIASLAGLHARLARTVAPARPCTLVLLQRDPARGRLLAILGPLQNVRWLTMGALAFTVSFVAISASPEVDARSLSSDIYTLSGLRQLLNMALLLSAAGMGSSFQALFTVQTHVSHATYDPVYDSSYWSRIGLGLVAGLMLSVMIPIHGSGDAPALTKPLLAVLGGFSAGLVHRVLDRLVETMESLFEGSRRDQQLRQAEMARTQTSQDARRSRLEIAGRLMTLRDELARGADGRHLDAMLAELVVALADPGPSPPSSAPQQPMADPLKDA